METSSPDVTTLLQAWCKGDQSALDQLIPLVEKELRWLAAARLRAEQPGHLLSVTGLFNETYLRLVRVNPTGFDGRTQFFALSAKLMRNILVDFARRQARERHAVRERLSEEDALTIVRERHADLVALDDTLTALAAVDARKSLIVEMRYFGGRTEVEIAQELGVSLETVKRQWKAARTWLYREMSKRT